MTPRIPPTALVLAAAALLAGCAAGYAVAVPDAPPTVVASAAVPFDGDCDGILTAATLEQLVGSVPEAQASVPAENTDGLVCTWAGSQRSLTVAVIPAMDAAPADVTRYALPECDPATGFCGGGIEAAELWIVVDFGFIEGEWEPIVSTALNAVAKAAEAHG